MMGVFRRKPKTDMGGAQLPDQQAFAPAPTGAAPSAPVKPPVAKRTARRPHPAAFGKRPL
jgi:hypothetical protein